MLAVCSLVCFLNCSSNFTCRCSFVILSSRNFLTFSQLFNNRDETRIVYITLFLAQTQHWLSTCTWKSSIILICFHRSSSTRKISFSKQNGYIGRNGIYTLRHTFCSWICFVQKTFAKAECVTIHPWYSLQPPPHYLLNYLPWLTSSYSPVPISCNPHSLLASLLQLQSFLAFFSKLTSYLPWICSSCLCLGNPTFLLPLDLASAHCLLPTWTPSSEVLV